MLEDKSEWMGNLPLRLQNMRITDLAIPGSHDSGSYSLMKNQSIDFNNDKVGLAWNELIFPTPKTKFWEVFPGLVLSQVLKAMLRISFVY